jgi:hypothetical protein
VATYKREFVHISILLNNIQCAQLGQACHCISLRIAVDSSSFDIYPTGQLVLA